MRIVIETINHGNQRYPTVGDWQVDPYTRDITILISETGAFTYNYLVTMHELAEVIWCLRNGIGQHVVDKWDVYYENMRTADPSNPQYQGDPGDSPAAPYHPGHRLGDIVERLMALYLDVNWQTYEATLDDLDNRYGRPKTRVLGETRLLDEPSLKTAFLGGSGLPPDYGRRSTIIPAKTPAERLGGETCSSRQDESEKEGIKTPKADTRVPRRQHEDNPPVKISPQSPKTDQGEGDGW